MEKTYKEKVELLANKFEETHSYECFVKACLSTINTMLIDKGVCTEEELLDRFVLQVEKAKKVLVDDD